MGAVVQRDLFSSGHVYVGVPPLYKVEVGKKAHYCYDEADLKKVLAEQPEGKNYNIQRFKGAPSHCESDDQVGHGRVSTPLHEADGRWPLQGLGR
jgi:hypothetical protein